MNEFTNSLSHYDEIQPKITYVVGIILGLCLISLILFGIYLLMRHIFKKPSLNISTSIESDNSFTQINPQIARTWKLITGIIELALGIPVLGGFMIILSFYIPLLIMLGLHITTLVVCSKHKAKKHGSILGIITSCVGAIPFVGMILHIITGILLLTSLNEKTTTNTATTQTPIIQNFYNVTPIKGDTDNIINI